MVNIKCELCGSNDLTKENDFFVCQHCGCKYTPEQAKKLIIEGVVNVEGKVEINTSEKIKNLYTIARRSKQNNDWDAAKKYYDLVLQEDPLSWEAVFYLAYFDAYYCKNGELKLKATKMCNCIKSVADLIAESNISIKEKYEAYVMISKDVIKISDSLQERARNFRNAMIGIKLSSPTHLLASKDQQTYYDTVVPMVNCKYFLANGIEKVINQFEEFPKLKEIMANLWKIGNDDLEDLFKRRLSDNNKKVIESYESKIRQYGTEQQIQQLEKEFEEKHPEEERRYGKAAFVFGKLSFILGIIFLAWSFFCFIGTIIVGEQIPICISSILLSAAPLVFGILGNKKTNGTYKLAKIGMYFNIISIGLGLIGTIIAYSIF